MSVVAERYRQRLFHCNTFSQRNLLDFEPDCRSLLKRSFAQAEKLLSKRAWD